MCGSRLNLDTFLAKTNFLFHRIHHVKSAMSEWKQTQSVLEEEEEDEEAIHLSEHQPGVGEVKPSLPEHFV